MDWVIAVWLGLAMAFVFRTLLVLEILPSSVLGELKLPPEPKQKAQTICQIPDKLAHEQVVVRA